MKTLADFNREYLNVHVKKEDLFWTTYMGTEKDPTALERAESEYKTYISDPKRFEEVRAALSGAPQSGPERDGLNGWLEFFQANAIESEKGRQLQAELIAQESAIFQKRSKLQLTYHDSAGQEHTGSTNVMAANIAASRDETVRKTSHEALLKLEQWVLSNGFIELIKKRNEFARALGFSNFFEYRVKKLEQLSGDELFGILEDFERRTRDKCFSELEKLKQSKGTGALLGHNLRFAIAGDVQNELDPYFPFEKALERWSRSFSRLKIDYQGATLSLDLFDRQGKYENGFMHGPQPCYFNQGKWIPARINFTSNATPNQVGSARRGLATFFHEGGHAAHFSNITKNAPCFSQEFPPTSMAYAETQSMFCDSLMDDADWLTMYAKDLDGKPMPPELIRKLLTADHPFRAFNERSILVVPVLERRLYSMSEEQLTPERITALLRQCEKEILGIDCSPRPILAIPHLLSGDGACSYQGYLLAHMAVYQTRAHFLKAYGHLTDNPKIGPDLAKYYWNPGNSLSHSETIRGLTGNPLSGLELANYCNLDVEDLWTRAQEKIKEARTGATTADGVVDINAEIRIVHGSEVIATNRESMQAMWNEFESWVTRHFPRQSTKAEA